MKIVFLDCISGISGDMTLGALIDSGVPIDHLEKEIARLGLSDYRINTKKKIVNHIEATKVDIEFDVARQPDRKYPNIVALIEKSQLSLSVKEKSLEAFRCLGLAEARIHGKKLEEIHFHEVGVIDSIIDMVGSIIGFEYLNAEKIYTSPIPLGTGFTKTEHGVMPVPSPAALEVLRGYPVVHRDAQFEMTTPTGATIVKILAEGLLPENFVFTPSNIGYGAGSKNVEAWPNVLRLVIGETHSNGVSEKMIMMEANIDDQNPEIYPYVSEMLLRIGIKDVFFTSVIMKKGRPGIQINILTEEKYITKAEQILFTETSTIGIRRYPVERSILKRELITVDTKFGPIEAKKIYYNNDEKILPEYESCKKIAREQNLPLKEIYREIEKLNG